MQRRTEHVVVISIDGLLPRYYLDERWPAPAMRQLLMRGAHAVAVRTVFPSLTYPAHTTLVTGALPAQHGVCNDVVMAPVEDPPWFADASEIRVPALWDAVHAVGGTSAALNWPVTVGAAIDWNLPDVWPGSEADVLPATRSVANPPDLLAELEREAAGRLRRGNFDTRLIAHDVRIASMAAYLFEQYRPTLLLVHTQAAVQIPQRSDWRDAVRRRAVAASDLVVSTVIETVERVASWDRVTVIVTGDHGMTEVHTQLRPNAWLVEAGLRERRIESGAWRATFHALGGAALLHVREPATGNVAAVRDVLDSLPRAIRETFRIVERDELDRLGSDPDAPLALAAGPGFVLDSRAELPAMRPNPGMTHGHHPDMSDMDTGLIAAGAGIRAGAVAPRLPLTAVAPIVAQLLGLDFAPPDGALYVGLLDDSLA